MSSSSTVQHLVKIEMLYVSQSLLAQTTNVAINCMSNRPCPAFILPLRTGMLSEYSRLTPYLVPLARSNHCTSPRLSSSSLHRQYVFICASALARLA